MKKLTTIYRTLLIAQVLFAAAAVFVKSKGYIANADEQLSRILQVVALVVAFGFVWGGMHYYRKQLTVIQNLGTPTLKMNAYTRVSLVKWAATEVPCIFSSIGYMLTGNTAFLLFAGLLLFVFAGYNPQKSKAISEMAITNDEFSLL